MNDKAAGMLEFELNWILNGETMTLLCLENAINECSESS